MPQHTHAEAFKLMNYQAADGTEEAIWNSRDGVTPFLITLRSGQEARHVAWDQDVYCPDHAEHMNPGDRYFADIDPETALAAAEANVERWWDDAEYPMSAMFPDRDTAARWLAEGYMQPGAPTLKEVLA